jgi:glycosyltransferase involved in cell wall biosynthesis
MIDGASEQRDELLILIPVFNDWTALSALLPSLDSAVISLGYRVSVLLVDDGSTEPPPELSPASLEAIAGIDILSLRRNLGHQRALAIGLAWIEANRKCSAVLIMDADGEDSPGDVAVLLGTFEELHRKQIVFAERTKRAEGPLFRFFYALYRQMHSLLTGIPVRIGNFSVVPFERLSTLVVTSDLWNHYAASVVSSRLPFDMVPTQRDSRLAGQPRMNFIGLIIHGLSAISVFRDRVAVRMLMVATSLAAITILGIDAVIGIRIFTDLAIPGWATYSIGLLLIILILSGLLILTFVFAVLGDRGSLGFLPIRDHAFFVAGVRNIYSEDA